MYHIRRLSKSPHENTTFYSLFCFLCTKNKLFLSFHPLVTRKIKMTTLRGQNHLIITNISKKPNIKSLLRTAAAFGCKKVFVVGQRKFNFDLVNPTPTTESSSSPNSPPSDIPTCLKPLIENGLLEIIKFDKLEECIDHIHSLGIRVLGVEIDEAAMDVEDTDSCFIGDTAFMMGNEGQGMNQKQMSLCDGFVKIKQYGGGTASLNVSVAAGIVLHRFHDWATNIR